MKEGFSGSRMLVLPQMIIKMLREDALMSQLYVTDIGYYPNAAHHRRERLEPVSQHVLIYCADGQGHYWVENANGKRERYDVGANQYFILPPHRCHCYWADKAHPWTIYWIHFEGSHASRYCKESLAPSTIHAGLQSRISSRHQLFEELYHVLESGYARENLLYACSCLGHYLASLLYLGTFREANPAQRVDSGNFVEAAIHFMREHIGSRLKLEDIARYTGFSASHFSAMFRKATGHAPLTYYNLLKMQEACQLLDNTSMKVNQICYKVGFDDCYYFSRLFTKIMGMSPTAYRDTSKG